MLTLLTGRAKTGKSTAVLRRIAAHPGGRNQILLVPEHASHQAEVDLCRTCGDSASRFAEVLSFRRLSDRVLSITGGAAQVTLDAGGKLLTLEKALLEVLPELTVYRRPSRKSAFLRQLLDLFDELRCYEVSPETLYEQSQAIAGANAQLAELAARFNRDKEAFHACVPGAPCPTCRRLITEEALVEVRSALEQSSMATIAAGQEQRAQLNELMENDKKAKAVFEQFQADDVAKLEQELAALKAQKTDNSPADGLRAQIQQLTSDLEYGNLNEVEYAQMKECREELRECAANLKAAQAAALQKPEDYDRKIEAAQGRIKELKKLIADVAIYVSERAKLTFSALKMNKVEISLYDVVKSTGERKDVFKFTYGGRRYDRLSLSEKIRAGMEVSELMKRLTGRNYPVFVDNMESVDDLNNVRPTGQVIMAKCVSGAPLAVQPVRPIAAAEQRAA